MLYEKIAEALEVQFEETVTNRRYLHQHPELSFQEINTKRFIKDKLVSYGYTAIAEEIGGGGILATLDSGKPGPVIGFRADFDGLAVQEETELSFQSTQAGVMHACGHDAHTAGLLSIARAVLPLREELVGKLVFIFQHAEEVPPGGAKGIVESGLLDDLDAVYGWHVQGDDPYNGKIYIHKGYAMAATDAFTIEIQGKGGHGASPHTSIDPAVIGAYLIQQLQTLVSRRKDPIDPAVLTIATFKAGEGAHNVISDQAIISGTVRTLDPEVQDMIEQGITDMTENVCKAHQATGKVKYERGYPSVYNYPDETTLVEQLFKEKFGEDMVGDMPVIMGGEDFAYYLKKKPGSFFFVSGGSVEQRDLFPHHHGKFTLDERSMLTGAKAFALLINHYLTKKVGEPV
ncbi:M20 metallopeptidase family protein [Amphibacillus cookii]|uniref:M20 metallopeptidase family protein n=1 Tax=Amphibacillus cookii TaxID=767787 RepID=UPI00195A44B0|nr:amidohydrolase [Amphibacillus cookii]MBM7542764.1 amidohydrolase [Amphibacillus cookii]